MSNREHLEVYRVVRGRDSLGDVHLSKAAQAFRSVAAMLPAELRGRLSCRRTRANHAGAVFTLTYLLDDRHALDHQDLLQLAEGESVPLVLARRRQRLAVRAHTLDVRTAAAREHEANAQRALRAQAEAAWRRRAASTPRSF